MNQVGIVYAKVTGEARRVVIPDVSFEHHELAPDEDMLIISMDQFEAVGNSVSAAMAAYK